MIRVHRWRDREGTEGRALIAPAGIVFQVTRRRGVLSAWARCALGSFLLEIAPERLDKQLAAR